MAKLLLITAATERAGVAAVNDLIGVFPDTWVFSPAESVFRVVQIAGYTKKQINDALNLIQHNAIAAEPTLLHGYKSVKYPFNLSNEGAPLLQNKFTVKVI